MNQITIGQSDKNSIAIFNKAKEECLKMVQKEIEKRTSEGRSTEYDIKDKEQILALTDFPKTSHEYRYLDVKFKAKILKAFLEMKYPENKFSVRIERYSGGSAIDAYWTGKSILSSELKEIENLFQDRGHTDSMTDYFDYDNYCHIAEDHSQYQERYKTFPECNFCGGKFEKMAITSDDKNCCMFCVNRREAVSFKILPKW